MNHDGKDMAIIGAGIRMQNETRGARARSRTWVYGDEHAGAPQRSYAPNA
jgi:hypothetical protein